MRKEGKISRVAFCPICDCFVMASHVDYSSKETDKEFTEFSKQGYSIKIETGQETRNREMKDCKCKKQ